MVVLPSPPRLDRRYRRRPAPFACHGGGWWLVGGRSGTGGATDGVAARRRGAGASGGSSSGWTVEQLALLLLLDGSAASGMATTLKRLQVAAGRHLGNGGCLGRRWTALSDGWTTLSGGWGAKMVAGQRGNLPCSSFVAGLWSLERDSTEDELQEDERYCRWLADLERRQSSGPPLAVGLPTFGLWAEECHGWWKGEEKEKKRKRAESQRERKR